MTQKSERNLSGIAPFLSEETATLGEIAMVEDARSSMGPYRYFPKYQISYPSSVTQALFELYAEYNRQFAPLVKANAEEPTDYQYCFDASGNPLNRWVQIDMVGLTDSFLEHAKKCSAEEVKYLIRSSVFEIENSLAMYELLHKATPSNLFARTFRASLDELRRKHGKKIALLAVTDEKYQALLATEFGKKPGEAITDGEVYELSGFDCVLSPHEFRSHVLSRDGQCDYLLYVRSSDPVEKLRRPQLEVNQPLLSDSNMRRIIKAHTLTLNIDTPGSDTSKRINDTKKYMDPMSLAYEIQEESDLITNDFIQHMREGLPQENFVGEKLTPKFVEYLWKVGVNPLHVANGKQLVRLKPVLGAYGCYGHYSLNLAKGGPKRTSWRKELAVRGGYVAQPELKTPSVVDRATGIAYGYIDRNFVTVLDGRPVFMGGFRTMLPLGSSEAQKGRYHGNDETVWVAVR